MTHLSDHNMTLRLWPLIFDLTTGLLAMYDTVDPALMIGSSRTCHFRVRDMHVTHRQTDGRSAIRK